MPGVDAYAGYMMAAAGFLALAHTLKKGEHIRVTLLLARAARRRAKRGLEIWALFAARRCWPLLVAVYSCRLAWQSYAFHDISTSNDATPLWLPQLAMALGTVVLRDRASSTSWCSRCAAARGRRRPASEALRNE